MGLKTYDLIGADASANGGAAVATLQATASPAKLFSITAYNNHATLSRFLQVYDQASGAPSGVPIISVPVASQAHVHLEWPLGRKFDNGILVGNSTADVSWSTGAADHLIDVTYRNT